MGREHYIHLNFIIQLHFACSYTLYKFYYTVTSETTYNRPEGFFTPREDELAAGKTGNAEEQMSKWIKYWDDESGYEFYYDEVNNVSTYERPVEYNTPRLGEEINNEQNQSNNKNEVENLNVFWSKYTDGIRKLSVLYNNVIILIIFNL